MECRCLSENNIADILNEDTDVEDVEELEVDDIEEYAGEARRGIDNEIIFDYGNDEESEDDPQLSTSQATDWMRGEGPFRHRVPTVAQFGSSVGVDVRNLTYISTFGFFLLLLTTQVLEIVAQKTNQYYFAFCEKAGVYFGESRNLT